jgi:2',3'-cyclic-nucleotide 2'-phosphodiesterase / 3'-nucleotidase / 5'-nucleotidase
MKDRSIKKVFSLLIIFTMVLSFMSPMANVVKAEGNVISVADAIANNSGTATVEGYIVGTVISGSNHQLEGPFTTTTNLSLADSPNETDPKKILPVQLPSGAIRSGLNLVDNPGNYHAKIQITGSLAAYFSVPGLRSPTSYTIIEPGQDPEPQPEPELTTISEARQKSKGSEVIIQGIVTANNTSIASGKQLSTYIQDETAGINIFGYDASAFPSLVEGQKIEVRGKLDEYNGLLEVIPNAGGIEILAENQTLPTPVSITLEDLQSSQIAEPLEGQLVTVNGFVQSVPSSPAGGGYNVKFIDSEFNSTTLRVMEGTNAITALEEGKWYDITAIVSQYDTYQLLPRKASDIQAATQQPEAPSPAGEYVATVQSVTDGDTIKLATPILGSDTVRYLNIDTAETYHKVNNELDQNQLDHGNAAKAYMNTLLKAGDEVIVKVGEEATDAYGRLLAQVIRKDTGLNTNLEMVKAGYATTYFIWPVGAEADYNLFQAAVKEAKDANLGIWNPDNPLMELPFEFRAREQGKGLLRYVGNSDTKKYVTPENFEEVPVEKRIFFVSAAEAESVGYTPAVEEEPTDNIKVQLLGVNDLHGKIDVTGTVDGVNYGRADYLATYLREREATNPNTLIVHAGDMVGGSSPVSALLQDEPTVEIMESIGFDVGTVGNHEFDEGVEEMLRLINGGDHQNGTANYDGINFPMVAANVEYKETGELVLPPYVIQEVGGAKIGFIGVATVDTPNMIIATGNEHIRFTDEAAAINKFVPELQDKGIEAIVVLAHVPGNQSGNGASGDIAKLANSINDAVDVIFAAHNHVKVNALVDNKLIVQAWEYGKAFADVDLEIDKITGDIVKKSAEIVDVNHAGVTPDPEVAGILAKYLELVGPKLNEVIGVASTEMSGGYATKGLIGDNALGNLIADGMMKAMDSDFALMNGGGIRDDLNSGDITWNELFNIQPFGNTLVKLEITGSDLKHILNTQFSSYGPDVSIGGFSYTWDDSLGQYGQVVDIYLPNGSKINPEQTYTVTVNNYMHPHSSDKYRLAELGENPVQGPEDLQATVDFIRSFNMKPLTYQAESRISQDITAPVSTATLTNADKTDETNYEATLELAATDSGVGVNYIEYSLDAGKTWTKYEKPITITNAGTTTVLYRARDLVWNTEETKSINVEITEASIDAAIELVQSMDVSKGIKTSITAQLNNAKRDIENNHKNEKVKQKFIDRGYETISKVSERVSEYKDHQMNEDDRNELTTLLDYIVENKKK